MHTLTDISHEVFKLKAGLFTLTTCHLFTTNLAHLEEKLLLMTEKTPHFFQQLPIILDLSSLDDGPAETIDFPSITTCLRRHKLIPIGVRGGSPEQQSSAMRAGLAVLANIKSDHSETTSSKSTLSPPTAAKVIKRPVRSGQQIYAKNSDLIVLTTVSPGAELLADGNIHIYGRLRGRALAGVSGDPNTHIFCRNLEAELVAIAGHYWLSEDLHGICPPHDTEGVHIFLHEERLKITTLA